MTKKIILKVHSKSNYCIYLYEVNGGYEVITTCPNNNSGFCNHILGAMELVEKYMKF